MSTSSGSGGGNVPGAPQDDTYIGPQKDGAVPAPVPPTDPNKAGSNTRTLLRDSSGQLPANAPATPATPGNTTGSDADVMTMVNPTGTAGAGTGVAGQSGRGVSPQGPTVTDVGKPASHPPGSRPASVGAGYATGSGGLPAVGTGPAQQVLLGRYEVRKVLGRGAMGEVLEVRDKQSGNHYALKRIPVEMVRDATQMAAIRDNFSLVSTLTHPHIATTRFLENDVATGQAYLIMDLVRGFDLSEWMVKKRKEMGASDAPMPVPLVLGIMEQVAAALDYAHSVPVGVDENGKPRRYGILHRDLKPANVMVEPDRQYKPGVPYTKLVDFGLAAEIQQSMQNLSMENAEKNKVAGTPAYMAPEQWLGKSLTRGMDQWALAVMIYEMISGRRPFESPSLTTLAMIVQNPNPDPPPVLSVPQWDALKVTFQADRKKRHRSCMALVKALADADRSTLGTLMQHEMALPDEFGNVQPLPANRTMADQTVQLTTHQQIEMAKSSKAGLFVAIAAVLLLGVGGFFFWQAQETAAKDEIKSAESTATAVQNKDLNELVPALTKLNFVQSKYSSRTDELKYLNSKVMELTARKEMLEKRKSQIDQIITQALGSKPLKAVELFKQAEDLAKGDAEKNIPDWSAEIAQRIKDPKSIAEAAAKSETAESARKTFKDSYELGKLEEDKKNWREALKNYDVALTALGEQTDGFKSDAEERRGRAKAEVKKRDDYDRLFAEGTQKLQAGNFEDSAKAFFDAQQTWPEAPNIEQLKVGLQSAKQGISDNVYKDSIKRGTAALQGSQWDAAETAFKSALAERKDDKEASVGLTDARFGGALAAGDKATQGSNWAEAEKQAKLALTLKPGNDKATLMLKTAQDQLLKSGYQDSLKAGDNAFTAGQWDGAETAYLKALEYKPNDPSATQKLAGARQQKFITMIKAARADIARELTGESPNADGFYISIKDDKTARLKEYADKILELCANIPQTEESQRWRWEADKLKNSLGFPAEISIDLGGGVRYDMVLVNNVVNGELKMQFQMGSLSGRADEAPVKKVVFTKPYYIGKYPVTVGQFKRFVAQTSHKTDGESAGSGWTLKDGALQEVPNTNWKNPGFTQGDDHPVVCVSYNDCQAFLEWMRKVTGRNGLRLPHESEWEFAARGPKGFLFHWGNELDALMLNSKDQSLKKLNAANAQENFADESDGYPYTSPVGAFKKSVSWCGGYDFCGNVWQWTDDWYFNEYYGKMPTSDPPGPEKTVTLNNGASKTLSQKVQRGGSWFNLGADCRATYRSKADPNACMAFFGFRPLLQLSGK